MSTSKHSEHKKRVDTSKVLTLDQIKAKMKKMNNQQLQIMIISLNESLEKANKNTINVLRAFDIPKTKFDVHDDLNLDRSLNMSEIVEFLVSTDLEMTIKKGARKEKVIIKKKTWIDRILGLFKRNK